MTERARQSPLLVDLLKNVEAREWPGPIPPEIELIYGAMFSGKTEELMRRARRAEVAHYKVQIFKHAIDTRYLGVNSINSHNGASVDAVPVMSSREIVENLDPKTTVVIIDEAQFFDDELPDVVLGLNEKNIRIILGGLLLDFRGEFFGPMPRLLRICDRSHEYFAICVRCGKDANRTQRMIKERQPDGSWAIRPANYNDLVIVVGADEEHANVDTLLEREEYYEARCRKCHEVLEK